MKPIVVVVQVDGGLADTQVVRDINEMADVVELDWDNLEDDDTTTVELDKCLLDIQDRVPEGDLKHELVERLTNLLNNRNRSTNETGAVPN